MSRSECFLLSGKSSVLEVRPSIPSSPSLPIPDPPLALVELLSSHSPYLFPSRLEYRRKGFPAKVRFDFLFDGEGRRELRRLRRRTKEVNAVRSPFPFRFYQRNCKSLSSSKLETSPSYS